MVTKITIVSVFWGAILAWVMSKDNAIWIFLVLAGTTMALINSFKDKKKPTNFLYYLYSVLASMMASIFCLMAFEEQMITRFYLFLITGISSIFAPSIIEIAQSKLPDFTVEKIKTIVDNLIHSKNGK